MPPDAAAARPPGAAEQQRRRQDGRPASLDPELEAALRRERAREYGRGVRQSLAAWHQRFSAKRQEQLAAQREQWEAERTARLARLAEKQVGNCVFEANTRPVLAYFNSFKHADCAFLQPCPRSNSSCCSCGASHPGEASRACPSAQLPAATPNAPCLQPCRMQFSSWTPSWQCPAAAGSRPQPSTRSSSQDLAPTAHPAAAQALHRGCRGPTRRPEWKGLVVKLQLHQEQTRLQLLMCCQTRWWACLPSCWQRRALATVSASSTCS